MKLSSAIVRTKSLCKSYGDFAALDQCTLEIEPGEVFGLLGPNGAGKTTLIRVILGFLAPSAGRAWVNQFDCQRQRRDVHTSVSYLPADARLFPMERGISVLRFFSSVRSNGNFDHARELAERLELDVRRRVALMSTGMRQKLALAVCLSVDAPVLILDEPTANLDPNVRRIVLEEIGRAKSEGRTVIMSRIL